MKEEIRKVLKAWNFINKANVFSVYYVSQNNKVEEILVNWYDYICNQQDQVDKLYEFSQKYKVKKWLYPNDKA